MADASCGLHVSYILVLWLHSGWPLLTSTSSPALQRSCNTDGRRVLWFACLLTFGVVAAQRVAPADQHLVTSAARKRMRSIHAREWQWLVVCMSPKRWCSGGPGLGALQGVAPAHQHLVTSPAAFMQENAFSYGRSVLLFACFLDVGVVAVQGWKPCKGWPLLTSTTLSPAL
jgi:hypothetical protein